MNPHRMSSESDDFDAEVRRRASEIGEEIAARLSAQQKRNPWNIFLEEAARMIGIAITIFTAAWYVGEPHLERYVDAVIKSKGLAAQTEIAELEKRYDEVQRLVEADRLAINALSLRIEGMNSKLSNVVEGQRETQGDIKLILQRLPRQVGTAETGQTP